MGRASPPCERVFRKVKLITLYGRDTDLISNTEQNCKNLIKYIYAIGCVNIRRSPPPQALGRGLNPRKNK